MVLGLVINSQAVFVIRKMGLDWLHFQKWFLAQCRNSRKSSLPQSHKCHNSLTGMTHQGNRENEAIVRCCLQLYM